MTSLFVRSLMKFHSQVSGKLFYVGGAKRQGKK